MFVSPKNRPAYIPPLGLPQFTKIYDFWIEVLGYNTAFRQKIIKLANIKTGQKILDVGCGTGTVLREIRDKYPDTDLTGIDPDHEVIEIARSKSPKENKIKFIQGYVQTLPFPDNSFDTVISSLTFHHLKLPDKKLALAEIRRVLKKSGSLALADHWPKEGNIADAINYWVAGHFDNKESMEDNRYLPSLLKEAKFKIESNYSDGLKHFLLGRKDKLV